MRINSTDATNSNLQKGQNAEAANKVARTEPKDDGYARANTIHNRNISHLTEAERKELPISEKVVIDAIEKANKAISISNRKFEYAIHEKTKEIMIKVIDSDTNEIVREIPPEKVLDMVAKMWEMAGLVVDERR